MGFQDNAGPNCAYKTGGLVKVPSLDVTFPSRPMSALEYDDEKQSPKAGNAGVRVLAAETQDVYDEGESGVDPVYQAKARILNDAFQEIGMGRYQVRP